MNIPEIFQKKGKLAQNPSFPTDDLNQFSGFSDPSSALSVGIENYSVLCQKRIYEKFHCTICQKHPRLFYKVAKGKAILSLLCIWYSSGWKWFSIGYYWFCQFIDNWNMIVLCTAHIEISLYRIIRQDKFVTFIFSF